MFPMSNRFATGTYQNRAVQREKTLPSRKRMMLIRLQARRTYPLEVRAMKEPPSVAGGTIIVAVPQARTGG